MGSPVPNPPGCSLVPRKKKLGLVGELVDEAADRRWVEKSALYCT